MNERKRYWKNITDAARSLSKGLTLTFSHIVKSRKSLKPIGIANENYFKETEGIATIQYPHTFLPVPDNGRYRLHNEIDDCIVCDKCAKICPVNCIDIEPVKAVEEIGKTSDGTSKRIYAAKFDIDMAKCCFCGLCTTVCPTECLTMTKVYDFSVTDIREHNFAFAEMTPAEIADKKRILEEHQKSKVAAQSTTSLTSKVVEEPKTAVVQNEQGEQSSAQKTAAPKPVFKPKIKPPGSSSAVPTPEKQAEEEEKTATQSSDQEQPPQQKPATQRPVFKPKIKPPGPPPAP